MEENKEDNKKPHRDRHSGRLIITVNNPNLGLQYTKSACPLKGPGPGCFYCC